MECLQYVGKYYYKKYIINFFVFNIQILIISFLIRYQIQKIFTEEVFSNIHIYEQFKNCLIVHSETIQFVFIK